jgi:DNA-directed RNA polymerase specialized sigma24 family protein
LASYHHAKRGLHLACAQQAESAGGNEDIEALAPPDGAPTPEVALIEKANAATIELAIGALPPPFKETLVLRDINGSFTSRG